ncbi:MAG: adenylate/guanylate cyclase domain-containing protein [Nitrososphaera sp.]
MFHPLLGDYSIVFGDMHPSHKKLDKIKKQDAKKEAVAVKNKNLKKNSSSSFLQSSSPNHKAGINSIMKKSETRVRKTLEGKPEFLMSLVETQNVLEKFASYKTTFVVLHVDLVGSTKLAMMLPLDRLTMMIQAFNQEMSIIVKAFGGYILKYIGDAVLAFFVLPVHKKEEEEEVKVACINDALNCAKDLMQVARDVINPILKQYECPEINLRIGVDVGENAIIQSGWDIHHNIRKGRKDNKNIITTKYNKEQDLLVKKPVYDFLGYTTSITVKMTALANPNHIVIGEPVYNLLDHKQRSAFQRVNISPDMWSYVCQNAEGNIYGIYTDV